MSRYLVSRYKDAPIEALRTGPAILYLAINICASTGAYGLAKVFGCYLNLGDEKSSASAEWTLGLELVNVVGMPVLEQAIRSLGDKIRV